MLLARAVRPLVRSNVGHSRRFYHFTASRGAKSNILDVLSSRSLLAQVTAPNSLRKHLEQPAQRTVYVGIDPSADSLHVGNLLPLLAALHFIEHGHRVIILIGGATGSIGDPSGRDSERKALPLSVLKANIKSITEQINEFFDRAKDIMSKRRSALKGDENVQREGIELTPLQKAAEVRGLYDAKEAAEEAMKKNSRSGNSPYMDDIAGNNVDETLTVTVLNNEMWYRDLNILTFLREVGKLARIGKMLARDSVKSRLDESQGDASTAKTGGLSYTEFSYQLLQAYDFSILHGAPWNCTIQLGGSDQMGNIMAGVDLIRKQKALQNSDEIGEADDVNSPAYGLTLPLLTTASGTKFGKSAGNAVWLSPSKCSDFKLYQYFYQSRDDEVEVYLKTLTMLPLDKIGKIMQTHLEQPSARIAQKVLASEVTELIRGKDAAKRAQVASTILFDTQLEGIDAAEVIDVLKDDSRLISVKRNSVLGSNLVTLVANTGLAASRTKARRLVSSGGVYINNAATTDEWRKISVSDTICEGKLLILRKGRSEHRIIALTP